MQTLTLIGRGVSIFLIRLRDQGARTTRLWLHEKVMRFTQGVSPAASSEVRPRLFVGGQQFRHGLATMRQMGIAATLSLRREADDVARGVALSPHLWLPTPDDGAPTINQLRDGVAFVRAALGAGQGVYIHCGQGVGRAPTMAAAYLMSEGQSLRSAMDTIRQVRPFITPTRAQLARLAEWAHEVRSDQ